jgi:hypothetical protein
MSCTRIRKGIKSYFLEHLSIEACENKGKLYLKAIRANTVKVQNNVSHRKNNLQSFVYRQFQYQNEMASQAIVFHGRANTDLPLHLYF